jgi:hypothetical protein
MIHRSSDDLEGGGGDPSTWKRASYRDDPVDRMEPIVETAAPYRAACLTALGKLLAIDEMMIGSRDPARTWLEISVALKLPSSRGYSKAGLAQFLSCSEKTLSRGAAKVSRLMR